MTISCRKIFNQSMEAMDKNYLGLSMCFFPIELYSYTFLTTQTAKVICWTRIKHVCTLILFIPLNSFPTHFYQLRQLRQQRSYVFLRLVTNYWFPSATHRKIYVYITSVDQSHNPSENICIHHFSRPVTFLTKL